MRNWASNSDFAESFAVLDKDFYQSAYSDISAVLHKVGFLVCYKISDILYETVYQSECYEISAVLFSQRTISQADFPAAVRQTQLGGV